jgi:peroxiredoxin
MEDNMAMKLGQEAPDFTLPSHLGKDVTLSDLRGSNVVIAFFPLAWTPV